MNFFVVIPDSVAMFTTYIPADNLLTSIADVPAENPCGAIISFPVKSQTETKAVPVTFKETFKVVEVGLG